MKHIYRSAKYGSKAQGINFSYIPFENLDKEKWLIHSCGRMISNLGRSKTLTGVATFGSERKAGYRVIYDGFNMRMVHRMVLEAFLPNSDPDKSMVDHINGIKNDNRLENLRWVTAKENAANRKPRSKFKHCETCSCNIK